MGSLPTSNSQAVRSLNGHTIVIPNLYKVHAEWCIHQSPHGRIVTAGMQDYMARWITDPGKRQKYMQARFDELALLTYPNGSAAGCLMAAKFLAWESDAESKQILLLIFLKIFNWDDQFDCGHLTNEPAAAASFVDMTIKQFHQLYNGCDSPIANESLIHPAIAAFREIGQELLRGGYQPAEVRLMEHITSYAYATLHVNQAHNAPNMTFTVDQYIAQRSSNAAGPALHHLTEYVHGLKIPDLVFEMGSMRTTVKESAIMAQVVNDLLSLNKEVKQEPDSVSLITVLMQHRGLTPQQAVNSAVELLRESQRRFVEAEKRVEDGIKDQTEKVQRDVRQFIATGKDWVVGALKWSYETPRYMSGARVLDNGDVLFLLGGNAQHVQEEGENEKPLDH